MFLIPNLNAGGAERVVVELSEQLSRLGNDVTIVMLRGEKQFYQPEAHVRVIALRLPHIPFLSKFVRGVTLWYRLRRLYKKHRTDVVIGFMSFSNIFAVATTIFSSVKAIISERNAPKEWDSHPRPLLWLRDIVYPRADAFFAQTPAAAAAASERFGLQQAVVIRNPLKGMHIDSSVTREKLILNVGRLMPQKGQEMLLEAFAGLDAPEWKLCILGEGKLREVLTEKARVLGIAERVMLPGEVRRVDHWLSKASIFAFTSLFEGIPNALIEAMAAGVPPVSFDCETGPSELIEHGQNGFLVPVGNVLSMQRYLQTLIDEPELRARIGSAATGVALRHQPEVIAGKLLELCRDVLADVH